MADPGAYPWEQRRPGELTSAYLGRVLDHVAGPGRALGDMPRRAREAHFDDYACPPDVDDGMNMHRLVGELRERAVRLDAAKRELIYAVVSAVIDGEFDGTLEESERWAASADGQAAFRELLEG